MSNLMELLTRVKISNLMDQSYRQGEDVKFDGVTDKVKMSNLIELLTK